MSVGTGWVGRTVKVTSFGGSTLAGVVTKDINYALAALDTTDDSSGGNAEYHSEAGRVDRTMSISGKSKNLDLLASIETNVANGQNIYAMTLTWPDGGSTLAGDVFISSFVQGNPHEELGTYEMELMWSGNPTFTAAI
ncbi:putative tail tube protein [Alteromonas phage XX1924]|nr:putative tail tube protein [Alteromonas phage XX1924]